MTLSHLGFATSLLSLKNKKERKKHEQKLQSGAGGMLRQSYR